MNKNTMTDTAEKRTILPRFRQCRRSLILTLVLLFSICSATDCFQQLDYNSRKEQRASALSLRTATALSGISLVPGIDVYGGGSVITDSTLSLSSSVATNENQRRRWDIFRRGNDESSIQRQEERRRYKHRKRRQSRTALDDDEYQQRKQEWADRYTTLDGLRSTFGPNKNKLYGDLDAATTRRLYKSLLPTAVCELVLEVEVRPEELAQLAYEARKAAKLYARERCHVPARLLANWYDGFRSFKRYGRFQTEGMSYDQVFDKYYRRSTLERSSSMSQNVTEEKGRTWSGRRKNRNRNSNRYTDEWTEEDIVAQTCMKILESACRTNPLVDRMTLSEKNCRVKGNEKKSREDLEKIAQTLEDDVRKLLDPYNR